MIRFNKLLIIFAFITLVGCGTVSSTIEGVVNGAKKDVGSVFHYSTCIFTPVECFD
tara:strand:+ start:496 stop:663 length:168 start_codon:yes stop_codon:yes gene_type:complete